MKKLKLAIISSYNELCGNATYAKSLLKAASQCFEADVLDLKTASLLRSTLCSISDKERHIKDLSHEIKKYDVINIHFEWGLYGLNPLEIEPRIIELIKSCVGKKVIVTVHSLPTQSAIYVNLISNVFNSLKSILKSDYVIITHLPKDKFVLEKKFNVEGVIDYPVVYLSKKDREHYKALKASRWKSKIGFNEDDIIISRLGFFAAHKDQLISLKMLATLPEKYKLVFIGGQVPASLAYETDHNITEITNFLDDYDRENLKNKLNNQSIKTLGDRVRFLGNVSDEDLYEGVACSDYITLTHREVGQSASGTASIGFELDKQMVLSSNYMFMEYNKYFENCFEFHNIGNHYELRDKILNFDKSKLDNLANKSDFYSLERLVSIYQRFADGVGVEKIISDNNLVDSDHAQVYYFVNNANLSHSACNKRKALSWLKSFIKSYPFVYKPLSKINKLLKLS